MKKKLLILFALCTMVIAFAVILSSCTEDADPGDVTTTVSLPTEYTVSFIAEGEVIGTQTYTEQNKEITEPEVPDKEHYSGRWESYTLDGQDKTVNAVYTPIEYTVTFTVNGEAVDSKTYNVENKSITVPEIPDVPFGYYANGEPGWSSFSLDGGNKTVHLTSLQPQARYVLEGSSYCVKGYNKIIDGKLEILSEYKGLPVTEISSLAFLNCQDLTSINIPPSVATVRVGAFKNCTGLIQYDGGAFYVDKWVIDCYDDVADIAIRSDTVGIGEFAFGDCRNLSSVTIPSTVKFIAGGAFSDCFSLVEVYNLSSLNIIRDGSDYGRVAAFALDVYTDINTPSKLSRDENGFIIRTDGSEKTLVGYVGSESDLLIPDEVTEINDYAFFGREDLSKVRFGANSQLKSIGGSAFSSCKNLTGVYFNANSQITHIYSCAFSACESLTEIIIPSSVTEIGTYAFHKCEALEEINIPSNVMYIRPYAFLECASLSAAIFENHNGWLAYGNGLPEYIVSLSDPATAVYCLTEVYVDDYWRWG